MGKEKVVWRGSIACLQSKPLEQSRCEMGFNYTPSGTRGLIRVGLAVGVWLLTASSIAGVTADRQVLWGPVTLTELQNQARALLGP